MLIGGLLAASLLFPSFAALAAEDISALTQAAEGGDVKAQKHLGDLYERGIGVPKDEELAKTWYTKAAEQGEPQAMFSVGMAIYSKPFKETPQRDPSGEEVAEGIR